MMADLQSQLEIIKRGTVDVLLEEELVAKLEESVRLRMVADYRRNLRARALLVREGAR